MIRVRCTTNLDVKRERWPTELPCRPVVGDHIEALTHMVDRTGFRRRLELRVCACCFEADHPDSLRVELHLAAHHGSIREFEAWYERMGGVRSA